MGPFTSAIQQLYVAYFNRPADPGGLAFWEGVVTAQNGRTDAISAAFASSQEYRDTYAGLDFTQTVNRVYQNLFGRDAEPEGRDYWVDLLQRRAITIDNVVTVVGAGAQGSDQEIYQARVSAADAFTSALNTPQLASGYDGVEANTLAREFISRITGNAALALETRTLNTTVADVARHGSSFTLTGGVDRISPQPGHSLLGNDIFIAATGPNGSFLSAGDSIDGGLGKNTLRFDASASTALQVSSDVTVKNISLVTLNVSGGATLDSTPWQGVTQLTGTVAGDLNLVAASSTNLDLTSNLVKGNISIDGGKNLQVKINNADEASTIRIGSGSSASGTVAVDVTSLHNSAPLLVKGGSTIAVSQHYINPSTEFHRTGAVSIEGDNHTTRVTVQNAAELRDSMFFFLVAPGPVTVSDAHANSNTTKGTIRDVSISGFANADINGNAFQQITLSNGSGSVKLDNRGQASPQNTTLNLNLRDFAGSFADANILTHVNLEIGGKVGVSGLSALALQTLSVNGSGNFFLDRFDNTALKSITLSGDGDYTVLAGGSKLERIDASRVIPPASGKSADPVVTFTALTSATFDPTQTAYLGGPGRDFVTLTLPDGPGKTAQPITLGAGSDLLTLIGTDLPLGTIDGGAGSDSLNLSVDLAAKLAASPATRLNNFEILRLDGTLTNQTIDFGTLGSVNFIALDSGGSLNLTNLNQIDILSLGAAGQSYQLSSNLWQSGNNNRLTVFLSDFSATQGVNFASQGITADGLEDLALFADRGRGTLQDPTSLTWLGNSVQTITLFGTDHFRLEANSTAVTRLDASNNSGSLTFTAGALTNAASIKGSSNINIIDLSAATAPVEYFGGAGSDTLTVNGLANTVRLGGGVDTLKISAAGSTLAQHTTVHDANAQDIISLPGTGNGTFLASAQQAGAGATLQSLANGVIARAANGDVGWFQFNGDTWLVQSRHDGTGNGQFINGTDVIVQLVGQLDLGRSVLGSAGLTLV